MYRIDVPSAASTLPIPSAAGTPGYFTDGDVVSGQEATVLPADFMNMLQEEFMAVVIAAGINPSKVNNSQILGALRVLFSASSSFSSLLAPRGYQQFPGPGAGQPGLILQWDRNTAFAAQSLTTVTFPIAFPNAGLGMLTSLGTALPLTSNDVGCGGQILSSTQGQIAVPSKAATTIGVQWWAFGW
ncbi:gp53-like domain-containing protein [Sphingomonas sp. UYP23]